MNVRDAIIQRLTERIMRMRAGLERFDDSSAERERVGANWNVRDLAGHMVFWAGESAEEIRRLAAGGKPTAYDEERINAEVFRKNKRMSFVMLLPQLRAAEERLIAAIRAAPADQLVGETPIRQCIDEQVMAHYDHHLPGLKSAAERAGPD